MRIELRNIFLGVLLTCVASQVFADNSIVNSQQPASKDPIIQCANSGGIACTFENLNFYQGNPNVGGAYFHCVPDNNQTTFHATDVNALITGFTPDGSLTGPTSDLLTYSFAAYADKAPYAGLVRVRDQNNNIIACFAGTGGLPVHPGAPGVQQP